MQNTGSYNGYAFYNGYSNFEVGTGLIGFLYRLTFWQTNVEDVSAYYDQCGSGLWGSCLWTCSFAQYYNPYLQQCLACDASCEYGFSTWGTCNQCMNIGCTTCTNYNNTCTVDSSNLCNTGLTLTASNQCCVGNCVACFGDSVINCLACVSGSYLLGDDCVSACPLGFSITGSNCVASKNPFIDLDLKMILDIVIDSASGLGFETGVNTAFYPSGRITDPIPVIQRGYFFTSNSYMQSPIFFDTSYNFTMVFCIKFANTGTILAKSTFNILCSVNGEPVQINVVISGTTLVTTSIPSSSYWAILEYRYLKYAIKCKLQLFNTLVIHPMHLIALLIQLCT